MGDIENVRFVPLPGVVLKDEDSAVCSNAAHTLGGFADRRAIEPLLDALEEESYVRESAALVLGALGDAQALPTLQRVQEHDTGEHSGRRVKDAEAKAIERIVRLPGDSRSSGTR